MTGPFNACITEALDAGEIDAASADQAKAAYDAAAAEAADLGPIEADRMGAAAALDALSNADLRARQLRALSIRSRRDILTKIAAWKRRRGYSGVRDFGAGGKPPKDGWVQGGEPPKKGPYAGAKATADFMIELIDGQGGLAGNENKSVKGRYEALRGRFDAMMAAVGERFETKLGLDTPGRAALEPMVREIFGEDTGDAASKMFAQAWRETAEHARQRFNAAGGNIGKLDGWGMPQTHDSLAIRKAGPAAWIEATLPRLDLARMIDRDTKRPFTEKRLRGVLSEIYDTIVTEGAIKREPGDFLGQGMMANRHAEDRFLVFKSADDWMGYQRDFGRADPYAAMMQHLDRMARDIAQMQVLGPNPAHQFDWLSRFAEREARIEAGAGAPQAHENARHALTTAKRMYQLFTGELGGPYGRENRLAKGAGFLRSSLVGAQLGSAVINDVVSNPVFAAKTRAFTGLSKLPDFAAWAGHLTLPGVRQTARRTGFIVDGARAQLSGSAQDFLRSQTVVGKAANGLNWFGRRMPTAVFKLSLLSPNLAAARWSFQHEFMGALHDRRGMDLPAMLGSKAAEDRALGETLAARGFTPAMWDKLRATAPDEPAPGAAFLSPMAVYEAGEDELSLLLSEMIERQTRLAVPEPSLWAQAHLLGESRPGTIEGEFRRSLGAYRSFTVTQTYLWSRELQARGLQGDPGMFAASMAGHAASLLIPLTLSGAAALQMKEMAKGNDPRPMDTPEFWAAALLQGGGLGVAGDFLFAAQSRSGKSSALTAMGSPAAAVSDLYGATVGNVLEVEGRMRKDGETFEEALDGAHVGRDAAQLLRNYTPLSSIWWTRAAWNRGVVDQLQKMLDPSAEEDFANKTQRLRTEFGQEQWWPAGQAAPDHAPDLQAALAPSQP